MNLPLFSKDTNKNGTHLPAGVIHACTPVCRGQSFACKQFQRTFRLYLTTLEAQSLNNKKTRLEWQDRWQQRGRAMAIRTIGTWRIGTEFIIVILGHT
jgi:hypothetical protein